MGWTLSLPLSSPPGGHGSTRGPMGGEGAFSAIFHHILSELMLMRQKKRKREKMSPRWRMCFVVGRNKAALGGGLK